MLANVGLDPRKDINFVVHSAGRFGSSPGRGRDRWISWKPTGNLRSSALRRSDAWWSIPLWTGLGLNTFVCLAAGNREFVRKHPVATKRALRAILKADQICALEPERVARAIVDRAFTESYEYALQTIKEVPSGRVARLRSRGYRALLRPPSARSRHDQEQAQRKFSRREPTGGFCGS